MDITILIYRLLEIIFMINIKINGKNSTGRIRFRFCVSKFDTNFYPSIKYEKFCKILNKCTKRRLLGHIFYRTFNKNVINISVIHSYNKNVINKSVIHPYNNIRYFILIAPYFKSLGRQMRILRVTG